MKHDEQLNCKLNVAVLTLLLRTTEVAGTYYIGVSKKKEDSSDSSQKTPRNLWSMAFIELPPSFLCTGSRPAPPSSLPLMARPLPPKWRSSAGGAARGCAWRKVPRIARVALNLLDGHDGIHDGLMVILKRMMLQDVIGYYSRPFTRMHWWNIQMWKEGLRVGQSLHRHGCLWQLFCGTEREAFGHRLLPDIVTWQWFLAHVSVPTKAVWLKSIVSCWWQFVIDIIVQVRHRTEYFLAKDAQQEASTQLRLDPWQGSWAFGHREVPALRNCKYQMNWLATKVISTNRPMKLNQNGTWFTVQVVRDVGVHSGKSQQDRSLAGSAFGRARGGDCREGQRLAVEHHDIEIIEFQLRAGICWDL